MKRQGLVAIALLGWALAGQPAAGQAPVAPIDGVCDESARNGCSAGTANDDAFPDYSTVYVWRCDGLHGGRNSEKCIKFVAVDGVCDETVRNGCAAGRPNDDAFPDHPTIHVWRCDGLHGGANSEKCARRPDSEGDGWSEWSACSATACAASGKQSRTCTDPPAGQRHCLRLDGTRGADEVRGCAGATPEDGGWSEWSACSTTACGAAGVQTRMCNSPAPGCGGTDCSGPSTRACTGNAPVDGGWSAWSRCSATDCNAGGTRTRSCTNPAPACGGQDCTGESSKACAGGDASDGVWETGAWSAWTTCTGATCTQSRGRSVTCAEPACGGAPCNPATKPAATDTRDCPTRDWQTGQWSAWSACTATACGVAGNQTRTRTVYCPCSNGCTGLKPPSSQTRSCEGNTPRHGAWRTGAWGPWSACSSSTCQQSRSRLVRCAAPGCGGNDCNQNTKPPAEETRSCSNPASPQWIRGQWGAWSECSATACDARGNKRRTRDVSCSCGSTACTGTKPATEQIESCTGNNPLNGACRSAKDACRAGTWKDGTDTGTHFKWRCEGGCGGTTAYCQSLKPPCSGATLNWGSGCKSTASGTRSGSSTTLTNTAQCRSGSATFACDTGAWGSATSATCAATPTNGSCNNAIVNGCASGTLEDVADTTALSKWSCVGSCDGTTAQCSKAKFSLLSVSISVSGGSGSGIATATVSGGTSPYTYSWRVIGGSIVGSASGRSISFSYRSRPAAAVLDFTVNVTDSAGSGGQATASWGTPVR